MLSILAVLGLSTLGMGFVGWSLVFLTDLGAVNWARLRGKRLVRITGVGSAIEGQTWISYVRETRRSGTMLSWRYPCVEVGDVELRPDGTGQYCGAVTWTYI